MRKFIDMTGERFGRLVCIAPGQITHSGKLWLCRCDCGNETTVLRGNLLKGSTVSCGCYKEEHRKENAAENSKHGHKSTYHSGKRSRTYCSWEAMRLRCNNPNHKEYLRYGGKGIIICNRWNSFENFLQDMGERPIGKTLDRIDGTKGYEPSNCRWATPLEQRQNRVEV